MMIAVLIDRLAQRQAKQRCSCLNVTTACDFDHATAPSSDTTHLAAIESVPLNISLFTASSCCVVPSSRSRHG
jgi:hypothetical protein